MTIDYAGNVSINNALTVGGALTIAGNSIQNFLFNNLGGNHGDITDFNGITSFGYKFIQGNTNICF